jgi:hypothetical protein
MNGQRSTKDKNKEGLCSKSLTQKKSGKKSLIILNFFKSYIMNFSRNQLIELVQANTNVSFFGLSFAQNKKFFDMVDSVSRATMNEIIYSMMVENELHRALSFCHECEKDEQGNLTPEGIKIHTMTREEAVMIIKEFWYYNLNKID